MEGKCIFGSKQIDYSISFSNRKTLGIAVLPDKRVLVKAPYDTPLELIASKVLKRASWITKQWVYFDSFGLKQPPRRYISGESHFYLGRQYVLRVIDGNINQASYKGRTFEVICKDRTKVESLMTEWYRQRAKIKFAEIAQPIISKFANLQGLEPLSIHILNMETRWGSCTKAGKIILNPNLIKVPKGCIEYVITHELCHLLHPNHNKEFYLLLKKYLPDWEKWKLKLEQF